MQHDDSTIAAIATAQGTAAIGLIRVSGNHALLIVNQCSNNIATKSKDRKSTLAHIYDAAGNVLDEVLLTVFHAPRSYTGENMVEISCHGGMLVMIRVLERIIECGAKIAEPGEFTKRAFINGRMDFTQAEAVMDIISAQSDLALRAAQEQREGNLSKKTTALRDELLECLAHIEAHIDFPEEDISPEALEILSNRINNVLVEIRSLLSTSARGKILREGIRTVIYGKPNAGKSSLLNLLAGEQRAIVSDTPGTTRDTIEERINLGGVILCLVDTAGIRSESDDHIENEGIRRANLQAARADLVLEIYDATLPKPDIFLWQKNSQQAHIIMANKCDLKIHSSWENTDAVKISSHLGTGIEILEQKIKELQNIHEFDRGANLIAINARHQECLNRAAEALQKLLAANHWDPELVSLDLRDALDALGDVTGKLDTEELLGVIFSKFCIGK